MGKATAFSVVERAGRDAPWLTLVHGATQHRGVFDAQVGDFAGRFRLLLVDLPGHGEAADFPGPYGTAEYASAVLAAMDAAGVERTAYWGTHTGSAVALLLATRQASRFAALVLEGAVIPGRPLASVGTCFERARRTAASRGLAAAREEWFLRSPWFDYMRAHPAQCRAEEHRRLLEDFQGAPWLSRDAPRPVAVESAALSRLDVPALILNGEHEVEDFLPAAAELAASLPRARRVTIPDTGGFPLWERPDRVDPVVADFLTSSACAQPQA